MSATPSSRRGSSASGMRSSQEQKPKETYEEWLARTEKLRATKGFGDKRGAKEEVEKKKHRAEESQKRYQTWLAKKAMHESALEVRRFAAALQMSSAWKTECCIAPAQATAAPTRGNADPMSHDPATAVTRARTCGPCACLAEHAQHAQGARRE